MLYNATQRPRLIMCDVACRLKCRLPSARARCSSMESSVPLPSRSMALNHCAAGKDTDTEVFPDTSARRTRRGCLCRSMENCNQSSLPSGLDACW